MKDDLGAAHRRPAHRLGIAPALMASRDAELEAADFEESPCVAGDIELVFARIDLILGLITLEPAVRVNDISRDLPARFGNPFHAENSGNRVHPRPLRHGAERVL